MKGRIYDYLTFSSKSDHYWTIKRFPSCFFLYSKNINDLKQNLPGIRISFIFVMAALLIVFLPQCGVTKLIILRNQSRKRIAERNAITTVQPPAATCSRLHPLNTHTSGAGVARCSAVFGI